MPQRFVRWSSCVLWLCWMAAAGCNALLGNERVQSDAVSTTQPDAEAQRVDAGLNQDGGATERPADVASKAEPRGAGGRRASQDSGAAGAAAADAGNTVSEPRAADSGAAGSGSDPQPDPKGIRGMVVDSYRRPVAGAWVWLGAESVQTDADGQFSFESATDRYDLTLTLSQTNATGAPLREVWRYEGLTRRDPTLQCYSGFSQRSGSLQLRIALDGFPQPGGPFVVAAFGSRDVGMGWWVDNAFFMPPALSWFGPAARSSGNVHALLYQTDATGMPAGYRSHFAQPAQVGNGLTDVTVSFALGSIPAITLSGRVTSPHERARNDLLVQHFADGTELTIPLSVQALETFSYLAPSLPDSTTTVVMREGGISPPYAAAVIEGSTAERNDLLLEIPRTPQLTAPGDGKSGVDETTAFAWTTSEPRVAMLVAVSASSADILYVVTESTETHLPTGASFGYSVPAATPFNWYVYTRDATSIDDVAADASHTLLTNRWTTGHYAASIPRMFVTAE